jgi:hypothetical protein
MVTTEKARVYKYVLDMANTMDIPPSIYETYHGSTLEYWKRQWFLIRQRKVHVCIISQQIYKKHKFCYYMIMHISKFCINQT